MVCMATSSSESTYNNDTDLSQKTDNVSGVLTKPVQVIAKDISVHVPMSNESDSTLDQLNTDERKPFVRPRSFSDASALDGKYEPVQQDRPSLERRISVKVYIRRESKKVVEPEIGMKLKPDLPEDSSTGRRQVSGSPSMSTAAATVSPMLSSVSESHDSPPPKPNLPASYSLDAVHVEDRLGSDSAGDIDMETETPPPKPALPDKYRRRRLDILPDFHKLTHRNSQHNVKHTARCSKDLKSSNSFHEVKSMKPRYSASNTASDDTEPRNYKYFQKALEKSPTHKLRISSTEDTHEASGVTGDVTSEKKGTVEPETGKNRRQSSIDCVTSPGVVYRSFDRKFQAEELQRELDRLRTSEHVRRRLSSEMGESHSLSTTGAIESSDGAVSTTVEKTANVVTDVKKPALKQSKSCDMSLSRTRSSTFTNSVSTDHDGTGVRNKIPSSSYLHNKNIVAQKAAFPPSGAAKRPGLQRGRTIQKGDTKPKIEVGRHERGFQRSKSEVSLGRQYEGSNAMSESHQNLCQSDSLQADVDGKTAQLRRRQFDPITKSSSKSVSDIREKVRADYHKHFDSQGYEDKTGLPSNISSKTRLSRHRSFQNRSRSDVGAMVSDNRSDEEKYAALSRNKILHSKSSSLDSQLQDNSTDSGTSHTVTAESSLMKRDFSSLTKHSKAASSESLNISRQTGNQRLDSDRKFFKVKYFSHDHLATKPTHMSGNSKLGNFVVRQCVVGSDVAFGLVGVQKQRPIKDSVSKPNGNGVLDGQGLVALRMIPDEQGRFGFNVKGGADQGMPIIVSRVAPNTPADNAIPRLNEGDQVLFINGRDVSQHTHEQVVMFIRASRESHTGELILKVRPNVYSGEDNIEEPDLVYDPDTHQISSSAGGGANALDLSLQLLEESLNSGAALAQFEQLYRKKPGMTMNSARLENNIPKNRYRDISPYDQTRVILKSCEGGDYINANYVNMEIPVSGIVNRYIAAQGPLPATCTDFWQMIWEQQSTLVVMLTTKVERGRIKCHQYWPDLYETSDYGTLQITCVKEEESSSFAFREFNLTHVETREERHISHMQYIAWPDHGVPDDPADFLEFVVKVRQKRVGIVEPSIVHCSAGIGRTGVLITMETAMCLVEANQPVYPLSIVRQMRDQRAMLIQTPSQYKFVCEAIIRSYNEGIVKAFSDYQR